MVARFIVAEAALEVMAAAKGVLRKAPFCNEQLFKFEKASHTQKIHIEPLQILFLLALAPLPISVSGPGSRQEALHAQQFPSNSFSWCFACSCLCLWIPRAWQSFQVLLAALCRRGGQV